MIAAAWIACRRYQDVTDAANCTDRNMGADDAIQPKKT
jgi:hypothetical protein